MDTVDITIIDDLDYIIDRHKRRTAGEILTRWDRDSQRGRGQTIGNVEYIPPIILTRTGQVSYEMYKL